MMNSIETMPARYNETLIRKSVITLTSIMLAPSSLLPLTRLENSLDTDGELSPLTITQVTTEIY
jgi:hypothetical protein